jgi:hypothetical protein
MQRKKELPKAETERILKRFQSPSFDNFDLLRVKCIREQKEVLLPVLDLVDALTATWFI